MKRIYHTLKQHPEALIALAAGLLVGFISLTFIGTASLQGDETTRYLVNLYKFLVGIYCIGISLFLFYGPRLHQHGHLQSITPSVAPRIEIPVLFGLLGVAACLTGFAITDPGYANIVFFRVLGFSILGAVATGYFVFILEQLGVEATNRRWRDDRADDEDTGTGDERYPGR